MWHYFSTDIKPFTYCYKNISLSWFDPCDHFKWTWSLDTYPQYLHQLKESQHQGINSKSSELFDISKHCESDTSQKSTWCWNVTSGVGKKPLSFQISFGNYLKCYSDFTIITQHYEQHFWRSHFILDHLVQQIGKESLSSVDSITTLRRNGLFFFLLVKKDSKA